MKWRDVITKLKRLSLDLFQSVYFANYEIEFAKSDFRRGEK